MRVFISYASRSVTDTRAEETAYSSACERQEVVHINVVIVIIIVIVVVFLVVAGAHRNLSISSEW